jgi:transposase
VRHWFKRNGEGLPILIATRLVNFRCGHQALALMVQTELKLDPHSGVTVVFRSKRGDRLKILVWDGTGMVLIYKVRCLSNILAAGFMRRLLFQGR